MQRFEWIRLDADQYRVLRVADEVPAAGQEPLPARGQGRLRYYPLPADPAIQYLGSRGAIAVNQHSQRSGVDLLGIRVAFDLDPGRVGRGLRRQHRQGAHQVALAGGGPLGGIYEIGALIALSRRQDLSAGLGLDRASRVLVIGTEGATDPAIYRELVGRAPEDITT